MKEYGRILAVRFVYSTNGQKIYELDLESGRGKYVETYPTPDELYSHTVTNADTAISSVMGEPYHVSEKKPRYYQDIAIRRTLEAMGAGQDRVLLTLATGTGKTYIAFQLAYKLFQSRWSRDGVGKRRPRILFLADRNVLVGQAMNDFNPLEKSCIKIDGDEIRRRR